MNAHEKEYFKDADRFMTYDYFERDQEAAIRYGMPFKAYYNMKMYTLNKLMLILPYDEDRFHTKTTLELLDNDLYEILVQAIDFSSDDAAQEEFLVYFLSLPFIKPEDYDFIINNLITGDFLTKKILEALLLSSVPTEFITKYDLISAIKHFKLEKEYKAFQYRRRNKMTTFRRRRVTQRRDARKAVKKTKSRKYPSKARKPSPTK